MARVGVDIIGSNLYLLNEAKENVMGLFDWFMPVELPPNPPTYVTETTIESDNNRAFKIHTVAMYYHLLDTLAKAEEQGWRSKEIVRDIKSWFVEFEDRQEDDD